MFAIPPQICMSVASPVPDFAVRRLDSLDCYTYSPTNRPARCREADSPVSTPSSTASHSVATPEVQLTDIGPPDAAVVPSSNLFEFAFTVGACGTDVCDFLGVRGEQAARVLNTHTPASIARSSFPAPIASNIVNFIYDSDTPLEVIKLESVHAANRYLNPSSPSYLGSQIGIRDDSFFVFSVNRQSVFPAGAAPSPSRGDSCFCYCMGGFEVVPLNDPTHHGFSGIVPVTYVVVSEKPFVDVFFQILCEIKRERLEGMREYWTSGILLRPHWHANTQRLDFVLAALVRTGWTPPGSVFHYDLAAITSSRPPISGTERRCEKSEFFSVWFSIHLVNLVPAESLLSVLAAVMLEYKVMVVSSSQSRRACAVMGLVGLLGDVLRWPHPCLASPPSGIAAELPNAPTPVMAGIGRCRTFTKPPLPDNPPPLTRRQSLFGRKRSSVDPETKFENCIFLDIDEGGCGVYWFSVGEVFHAIRRELSAVVDVVTPVDHSRREWAASQVRCMGDGAFAISPDQLMEGLQTVDSIRGKLDKIVTDLARLVVEKTSTIDTYPEACAAIDSVGSDVQKSLFRSQAFQLKLLQTPAPVPPWLHL